MTDVNVAFREEKLGQIAMARQLVADRAAQIKQFDSGAIMEELNIKLARQVLAGDIEMVGPDRYRVLTGFDAGEYFNVRRPTRPQELPLILPQSGLEERDGKTSLFTRQPAWHDLGYVADTDDIEVAIREGGLDFGIEHREVWFYDDHGKLHLMPGKFVTARDDTWDGLGVVGKIHKSVNPREALGWLQSLTGSGALRIESAGVLRGGAKTFLTVSLPDTVSIDPQGVNIEVQPYLAFLDDHAGERKLWAVLTPWVIVCGNTHNFALRDAMTRWGVRHSTNIHEKLAEAQRTLGLTVQGYKAFTAEEEELLRTPMSNGQFEKFLATLYPRTDEDSTKNAKTREAKRDDEVHEALAFEVSRLGQNWFAGEMALTGYWDNQVRQVTDGKSAVARATSLLEGEDDRKNAVHKQLLVMAGAR